MSDLKSMYSTVHKDAFPDTMTIILGEEKLVFQKRTWTLDNEEKGLRYGENPHQSAAWYHSGSTVTGWAARCGMPATRSRGPTAVPSLPQSMHQSQPALPGGVSCLSP